MENEILQDKSAAYIAVSICALAMTVAAWGLAKLWTTLMRKRAKYPRF